MRLRALFVVLIATTPLVARASDYSPGTHYYQVNYSRPVAGMGEVRTLDVIFSTAVTSKQAESFLRGEILHAIDIYPPTKSLLATAWLQTSSDAAQETMIKMTDGSNGLIYEQATGEILTLITHTKRNMPVADESKTIEVTVGLELERNSSGKVRIIGKTNLPDGTLVMLGLSNASQNYRAQDKIFVSGGRFESAWFSARGAALPAGTYDVSFTESRINRVT